MHVLRQMFSVDMYTYSYTLYCNRWHHGKYSGACSRLTFASTEELR